MDDKNKVRAYLDFPMHTDFSLLLNFGMYTNLGIKKDYENKNMPSKLGVWKTRLINFSCNEPS